MIDPGSPVPPPMFVPLCVCLGEITSITRAEAGSSSSTDARRTGRSTSTTPAFDGAIGLRGVVRYGSYGDCCTFNIGARGGGVFTGDAHMIQIADAHRLVSLLSNFVK